jgi:hypothetical protein
MPEDYRDRLLRDRPPAPPANLNAAIRADRGVRARPRTCYTSYRELRNGYS